MPKKYPEHDYSQFNEENSDDQVKLFRLRFRAYRQAANIPRDLIAEKMGQEKFAEKFEMIGTGPFTGKAILKISKELGICPIYLHTGSLDRVPKIIADRIEAIWSVGHTIQDGAEVDAALKAAGVRGFDQDL